MTRRFGAIGPTLHRAGWDVVPIKPRTKRPVIDGWQRGFSTEQVDELAANGYANGSIGLLARKFPGVDIDVLDQDCADAIERCALEVLGTAPVRYGTKPKRLLIYRTDEPFAKVKLFLRGPMGDRGADGKKFAVEFLGDGQQYVIYGEHPDGFEYSWPASDGPADADVWELATVGRADVDRLISLLPEYLPAGWSVIDTSLSAASESGDALAQLKTPLEGWDIDRVDMEILPYLTGYDEYEEWVKVGMALHHQGDADPEWLDLWDNWSSQSSKWMEGACEAKWTSFSEQRFQGKGAVTLASLIHETKPAREAVLAQLAKDAMEEAREAIAQCPDDVTLRSQVADKIKHDDRLDKAQREILGQAWNARHRELAGVKLPVGDVRRMLGTTRPVVVQEVNAEAPEWAQPWVFVTEGDKFFNIETKQEVTSQGFRSMHNRLMPFDEHGNRERADVWATDMWALPVVAHKAYMPSAGPVFEMFGLQWVNLYRPESAPEEPASFSSEDLDAIAVVQDHFNTYLSDQRERDLLLSWIAHQVQHPGVKVRWSPYVHGVPGDGKSFFSELIAVAMGAQNVRSLNGSTLESNFTDWAVGYAVVAIEEMKQHGHNRYDIMNRVKPFITNTAVEIHPKGRPSYTAPNVSNYIIFSNYLDGAPVDEGDRRYMFLSSRLTTEDAKQLTEGGYFKRLFDAVNGHAGAIRKWLLGVGMHAEFDPNGRAPDTDIKHTVIEMSKADLDVQAEELVEKGAPGVGRLVISSAHFTRALQGAASDAPAGWRVNGLLTRLGYRFACRKKWKGEACRIWVKQGHNLSDNKIVEELNASLVEEFLQ
jgi:hypothetical protein